MGNKRTEQDQEKIIRYLAKEMGLSVKQVRMHFIEVGIAFQAAEFSPDKLEGAASILREHGLPKQIAQLLHELWEKGNRGK